MTNIDRIMELADAYASVALFRDVERDHAREALKAELAREGWDGWKLARVEEPVAYEYPEWSRMDDLGGVVPSEVRVALSDAWRAGYKHGAWSAAPQPAQPIYNQLVNRMAEAGCKLSEQQKMVLSGFEPQYAQQGCAHCNHPMFVGTKCKNCGREAVQPLSEPQCKDHPDAPHGFNRDASHNEGRYVCDCEGWTPPKGVNK